MTIKPLQHVFLPALCTALGASTLAAVLFVQASREADALRGHTEALAQAALVRAGHAWARFHIDDDEGRLIGEAPDPAQRQAALQTLRTAMAPAMAYPGVFRKLADASHLAPPRRLPSLRPVLAPLVDIAARCTERVASTLGGRRILFETGSSRLTAESRRLLEGVARVALDCPAARLSVLGHTDATGQPDLNQRLSQARAEAVATVLVQAGVAPARVAALGMGASRPLAIGDDAAARAQNRRIEFVWTSEAAPGAAA